MARKINAIFSRWGLAVACVVAPIVLGVLVNGVFVSWLTAGSEFCAITRQLSFTLIGETKPSPRQLSAAAGKHCDEAMARRAKEAAPLTLPTPAVQPAPVSVAPPAAAAPATKVDADKPSPQLQLVANHAAGRLNVAYGYAFLTVVSVVAFAFGSFVVVSKQGWKRWAVVAAIFGGVTIYLTQVDLGRDGLRYFVADNILARADAHALLQYLPASDNLRILITFGLCMGYWAVGLVLASLFLASIRKMNHATLPDLKERLFVIRAGLILGSAILVVVVLSSRAVFDWPLSLLAEPDRKALMPVADALVRKWGAIGSIALITAFLPAIMAWYLDRDCYRSRPHPPPAPPPESATELEIAPMSTVTSIVAILAPLLASPIFDAFKSLIAAVPKP